jgi:aminopeptidase N
MRSHVIGGAAGLLLLGLATVDGRQEGEPNVATVVQTETAGRSPRNANYDIDVLLDHAARELTGHETIRWRNISAHPTRELQFHLYWNAWRNVESTWLRERRRAGNFTPPRDDAWSAIDVMRLRVRKAAMTGGSRGEWIDLTEQQRFIAPDDGNAADRTVMSAELPWDVLPSETIEVEVEWHATVPRPFARTGYRGDYYFIAQWFPKIGVLEDSGWNTHQFHATTEFYSDYGVYDVRITVPERFIVGASGRDIERLENADGTVTHRYEAEDIHDFAWTTSPDFLEDTQTFKHPTLPDVNMRLLLQPEHAGQESRHFAATAATLKYYGEWFGAYPYDHITIIDPAYRSGSGGMEYPTLFTAGSRWLAPERVAQPERVTIHEAGHQFWYGIVGSNEFEHAWMDEGINTFSEARVTDEAGFANHLTARFFGNFVPWVLDDIPSQRATDGNRLSGYRRSAEAETPATPSFRYWPGNTWAGITYYKPALWLHTLERRLGWPVLQRILSTYFDRWKFKHPQPADFFAVVNEVSGQDMTWFFDQVYRGSNTFDYGVQRFTSTQVRDVGTDAVPDATLYRTLVVVQRLGEAIFPVAVVTTLRDGERITEQWDGRDRRAIYTYERTSQAVSVQVDPERVLLLDVDYTNNSATLEPRADEAGLKWSLTWLAWLQDLMLTYAFFV